MGSVPPTCASAHHRPRQLADDARSVGDPVEPVVVKGDQHPVGGHVHVGLDVAVPEGDGGPEGGHGVLGGPALLRPVGPPVGEGEGARCVEEGPRRLGHACRDVT